MIACECIIVADCYNQSAKPIQLLHRKSLNPNLLYMRETRAHVWKRLLNGRTAVKAVWLVRVDVGSPACPHESITLHADVNVHLYFVPQDRN